MGDWWPLRSTRAWSPPRGCSLAPSRAAPTVLVRTQGQGIALSGTLSLCFCFCASSQPTSPTQGKPTKATFQSQDTVRKRSFSSPPKLFSPQSLFENLLVFCRQLFLASSVTEFQGFVHLLLVNPLRHSSSAKAKAAKFGNLVPAGA